MIAIYAAIAVGLLWTYSLSTETPEPPPAAPPKSTPVVSACSTQPQPTQGVFRNYDSSPHVAEFTVRTAAGSRYFIKLEDTITKRPVMTFFVNGGSSITENVPLGNFIMKYATGQFWCGMDELFGADTVTNTVDRELLFAKTFTEDGYSITVLTVYLIALPGGNLKTHRILRNEF